MLFKFQVFSDLHQEYITNIFRLPPKADILFLAGDINRINKKNYKQFFDYVSENWKHVFYVPGNHEYYDKFNNIHILKQEYKLFFSKYNNVHFLDNNTFILNYNNINIKIIGSTLWSKIVTVSNINDFNNITEGENQYITKDTFNKMHDESVSFILKELNKERYIKTKIENIGVIGDAGEISDNSSNEEILIHDDKMKIIEQLNEMKIKLVDELNNIKQEKIIIMTHFPPSQCNTSSPVHSQEAQCVKDYFASNTLKLLNGIDKSNILCWIYGHTHYSNDFIDNETGIRLISNQLGYLQEHSRMNMDSLGVFEIEIDNTQK